MAFVDPALPRADPASVFARFAAAPSPAAGLEQVLRVNPIYERLRQALDTTPPSRRPLLLLNLDRARALPADPGPRFILADITAGRLWLFDNGRASDSMRIVVGRPGEPTPAMAGLMRRLVQRPYWNMPPDLVRKTLAPAVLRSGPGYLDDHGLMVLSDWSDQARPVDPWSIDWSAVAAGTLSLRVRQEPGPDNMMGQVKFVLPNPLGIFLHDTPYKSLFRGPARAASAGCIRLQDARRLARWLLGREPDPDPAAVEQQVELPAPTPVYLLYLTLAPGPHGALQRRRDIYGRDAGLTARRAGNPSGSAAIQAR